MSASSKPKGHAPQLSVADAATLFGSAADDPFASILGSEPGLGGIGEEAEDETAAARDTSPPAAAIEDAAIATPKAHSTALPEVAIESLHAPTSNTAGQSSLTSSPSALFTSSTTADLFSDNNGGDWLGQNGGETEYPNDEQATEWNGQQDSQQAFDYSGGNNGTDYGQYYEEGTQYDEQPETVNGHQEGTYQQHPQGHQEQYNQYEQHADHYGTQAGQYDPLYQHQQGYDQSADQYNQYSEQQPGYDQLGGQYDQYNEQQQGYDALAYDYGQHGYDESSGGYQQDSQMHAEQYNQYNPSLGQPDPYSQQQQPHDDPSLGQYDPSFHQQNSYEATSGQFIQNIQQRQAFDPESEQYEPYNQQQAYDPALYGQAQEENVGAGDYPTDIYAGQEDTKGSALYPSYDDTAQDVPPQDLAAEIPHQEDHQYAAEYPSHDYAGQQEGIASGTEGYTAPYPNSLDASLPPQAAPFAEEVQETYSAGPYTPSANDNYSATLYTPSAQDKYGASNTQEPAAADETVQQHQGYADWSGANNEMAEGGQQTFGYSESGEVREDESYPHSSSASGYFDNVAFPPALQTNDDDQQSRSLEVTSPYEPRLASAGFSSMGEGAYTAQDRTLDAAEEKHRAKIPLASFSIDGKLLTFFPTWSQDASEDSYASGGGYGMGGSAAPTKVTIRPLRSVISPNSYASSKNPLDFPGPALEGESSQGSALSRATGASASTNKAKKIALIKYLNDAAADMASGISYLSAGKQASEARRIRDRILILRMLVLVLEHDGNLVNNVAFDSAAKNLLVDDQGGASVEDLTPSDLDRSPIPGPSVDQKARFLHQMEDLLMSGQRKEAVDLAVQEKMWTHAVVVASGMDRATWRDVVGQFVEAEFDQDAPGQQGLKVAYHLFSGQEPKTTHDLFRRKTSLSSNGTDDHDDKIIARLSQWRKSVATILANRSNGDSATLTAIGDGLALSGWIEAAHVCYLLSPQTSPMEGYDGASTRMTLLGANSPEASTLFVRDLDHIILTEVFEYALSLQPVVKGAEAYHGLAYLQSYRLVHAYLLAEMGDVKGAIRYCDSIMTLLKHGKMNRYYHPILLLQLQELSNRLQGDTKSTSWTKKKPTMDGVWSALEGRFTKFIAGEEGSVKDSSSKAKGVSGAVVGPFSHYSAITPEARAGGMSRVHSTSDIRMNHPMTLSTSRPQSRPGSALSLHPQYAPLSAGARSVSEYGYDSRTPPARDSSALSSPKFSLERDSSEADIYNGPFTTHSTAGAPWYGQESIAQDEMTQQTTPVDAPYYGYEPHGASQPQFISNVDTDLSQALNRASIDDHRGSIVDKYQPVGVEADEDEDDLGFGNKSTRSNANKPSGDDKDDVKQTKEIATPEKKKDGELKPAASWFGIGKLWSRGASSEAGEPKAKKAHLGEETSFYYDETLKRWINRKAGDTGAAASPPPAPPRAQTASPSSMGGSTPSNLADAGPRRTTSEMRPPPPSSPGSSLGRGTPPIHEEDPSNISPTKSSLAGRSRSNLAEGPPALQPPIRPGSLEGGPPRAVSSSAIKKRAISKRYVRVD